MEFKNNVLLLVVIGFYYWIDKGKIVLLTIVKHNKECAELK